MLLMNFDPGSELTPASVLAKKLLPVPVGAQHITNFLPLLKAFSTPLINFTCESLGLYSLGNCAKYLLNTLNYSILLN